MCFSCFYQVFKRKTGESTYILEIERFFYVLHKGKQTFLRWKNVISGVKYIYFNSFEFFLCTEQARLIFSG